LTKLSSK